MKKWKRILARMREEEPCVDNLSVEFDSDSEPESFSSVED